MKKLVVYYSKTGNTKFIAETIANEVKADIKQIERIKERRNGITLYMFGGFEATFKVKPKIKPLNINFKDYDLIFIGTPVWAFNINPAVRSFYKKEKFTNKKVGLFYCSAGNGKRVLREKKNYLKGNEILGEKEFIDPLSIDKEANIQEAKKWAKEIVKKASSK